MQSVTGLFFIAPFYNLAFNLLVVFYRILGGNLGIAIIFFTLFLKFLTLPFALRQINSAKKTKEFQDKYKLLQEKHKGNKDELTKELAKLQGEYLPAQLGGCLPLILQLLFFFQVYYVIINIINVGTSAFNSVNFPFVSQFTSSENINLHFLTLNLGKSASSIGLTDIKSVWPYLLLVLLVGGSQYFASRVNMGLNMTNKQEPDKKVEANLPDKSKKKNKQGTDLIIKGNTDKPKSEMSFADAMQSSSKQMLYILPIMTMILSLNFPAGVSLYWTVNSGFVIIQQLIVRRQKLKSLEKSNEAN